MFATYKTPTGLHFAEATTYPPVDQSSWNDIVVDGTAGAGSISRIKYDNDDGRFYILAHNVTNSRLYMSHCVFLDRMTPASWTTFFCSLGSATDEGAFFDFAFDPMPMSTDIFYVYYAYNPDQGFPMAVRGIEGALNKSSFNLNALEYNPGQFSGRFCSMAFGNQRVVVTYQEVDGSGLQFLVSPYVSGVYPLGWVGSTVPDGSVSPLADTNALVYNGNIAEIVYGRDDGIYFASLVM
jgi:hypothetical protein